MSYKIMKIDPVYIRKLQEGDEVELYMATPMLDEKVECISKDCKQSVWCKIVRVDHGRAVLVKDSPPMPGYHLNEIPKGELGKLSKIREELDEAFDAEKQNNPIMLLLELSDIIGAVEGYLEKNHPTITLDNLINMARATHRAFESGERK